MEINHKHRNLSTDRVVNPQASFLILVTCGAAGTATAIALWNPRSLLEILGVSFVGWLPGLVLGLCVVALLSRRIRRRGRIKLTRNERSCLRSIAAGFHREDTATAELLTHPSRAMRLLDAAMRGFVGMVPGLAPAVDPDDPE